MRPDSQVIPTQDGGRRGMGVVLGLWLAGVFAVSLLGRVSVHGGGAMALMVISVCWPAAYFALAGGLSTRPLSGGQLAAIGGFSVAAGLSGYFSPVAWESMGYFLITLFSFLLALQFNSHLGIRELERGLKLYAALMTLMLAAFAVYEYTPGVRLGNARNILNPNAVAMVSVSVILASSTFRNAVLRYAAMGSGALVLVLTGSRASAVAVLAGLAVIGFMRRRERGRRAKFVRYAAMVAGVVLLVVYLDPITAYVTDFFQLDSRNRGLDSGASGRMVVWRMTWNLFLENPMFGVGFRAHEHIIQVGSAHNGYLAMLAEVGIIGFAGVAYLIGKGMTVLWRDAGTPEGARVYGVMLGLSAGYMLLALFERYLLNVGNPTSLLFLLAILRPATKPLVNRRPSTEIARKTPGRRGLKQRAASG